MTRRDRLERKVERRLEWADKAQARSDQHFETAHRIGDAIPFGQPILVGHHSERHHRRDVARIHSNMSRAVENDKLAKHHAQRADGLAAALDRSIFSDDNNAIDALEARIAEHEAQRERMKQVNKLYRKADAEGLKALGLDFETIKAKLATLGSYFGQAPHMPYELSNLGGRITTDRKRLEFLKQQATRKEAAESSSAGMAIEKCAGGYVRITFAEKPAREVLDALKAAGYWWAKGSWAGKEEAMPECIKGAAA